MKTVLITGVSSGIGHGLLREFVDAGYNVIGSVRNSAKALELQTLFGKKVTPLLFDITNHREIDDAAVQLQSILGDNQLSGLINNAGMAEIGPLLHVSMNDIRKQFETLVFGQLYIIQKVIPFLIPEKSKLPPGRIVNISSVSGKTSNYLFGCYSAGKHAFEGLSKTLREELKIYGVKVIVVAPGNIATPLWGKQTESIAEKYKNTLYYASLKNRIKLINTNVVKNAMGIEEFSKVFLKIFLESKPAERYTICKKRFLFIEKIIARRN